MKWRGVASLEVLVQDRHQYLHKDVHLMSLHNLPRVMYGHPSRPKKNNLCSLSSFVLTTISWKYKPPSRSKGYIIEEIS
jgi:hypothetical protein